MKRAVAIFTGLMTLATLAIVLPTVAAAEPTTTITMNVNGCNGCTITPVQAVTGAADVWTGSGGKVTGGSVVLTVPTARTVGMSFNLDASWQVDINAIPVIVTQYQGFQPGQRVTRQQAMAAKRATACWAGTAEPAVTLRLTVRRVWLPGFPEGTRRTKAPLAWLVPTAASTGGFSRTSRGVIAQQEAWYCPAG
jgi:hypothetical protein